MKSTETFNWFAFDVIKNKMKKDKITLSHLSFLTGISARTLGYLLKDKEKFEKTSIHNITVILNALKINEKQVVEHYYKAMYDLGNDNFEVAMIVNMMEGCVIYNLQKEDFYAVMQLLEKLAIKKDDTQWVTRPQEN